ncbi:MAG: NIF family HAD-type phosphatase [Candidatus Pacebacteria bacterium]|nr:NIF family HAD-type phosphatase [Candidatus Paceibacterota bacterium]
MRATEEEPPKHIMMCSQPSVCALPVVRDSQSKKNPFRKHSKQKTTDFSRLTTDEEYDQLLVRKGLTKKPFYSTETVIYRARVAFDRIPKPLSDTEAVGEDEDLAGKKLCFEVKADEEKVIPTVPAYALSLSNEIKANFEELKRIGYIPIEEIEKRQTSIPDTKQGLGKKTLFLDLDDTLVHTINPRVNYDAKQVKKGEIHQVKYEDQYTHVEATASVILRPYVRHFLRELKRSFELVVMTSHLTIHRYSQLDAGPTPTRSSHSSIRPQPSSTTFCTGSSASFTIHLSLRTCGS